MDWLRSCYRVPMIFREGDEPVMVRWYFCDEDAECFPYNHVFGSQNWEREKTDRTIGEQAGPREWVDGERPVNGTDGQDSQHCFDPEEWWIEGIPEGEETGPYWPDGSPKCCNPCNCVLPDKLYLRISDGLCGPVVPIPCVEETISYLELNLLPGFEIWAGEGPGNRADSIWRADFFCDPMFGQWCILITYTFADSNTCGDTVCITLTCPDPFQIGYGQVVLKDPTGPLPCPCDTISCVDLLVSTEFIS